MNTALIIFVKNPVYGKVKTRLAATLGHLKALEIYRYLLHYTRQLCRPLPHSRHVYFEDHMEQDELWVNEDCVRKQQQGSDLGRKMMHAFREVFSEGYRRVLIIGSDCPELTGEIIELAYAALEKHDVVIGPAADGGYYLLGLTAVHEPLFDMPWSTDAVLRLTIGVSDRLGLSHYLLPQLNDIDVASDWAMATRKNNIRLTYDQHCHPRI